VSVLILEDNVYSTDIIRKIGHRRTVGAVTHIEVFDDFVGCDAGKPHSGPPK